MTEQVKPRWGQRPDPRPGWSQVYYLERPEALELCSYTRSRGGFIAKVMIGDGGDGWQVTINNPQAPGVDFATNLAVEALQAQGRTRRGNDGTPTGWERHQLTLLAAMKVAERMLERLA